MRWIRLTAACLLTASTAFGHGSDRLKITESVELAASPAAVWAVIGNFHDMGWDPLVAETTGDGGNTLLSIRTVTLKSGGRLIDDLERYDAAQMSYSTFMPHNDVHVLPVTNFSTVLTVRPGEHGGSVVEWRAAAFRGDPNDNPPPDLNDATAAKAMEEFLKAGLDGLKQRFGGV
jgi:hypothetical protein